MAGVSYDRRFSEERYATKEEVAETFNVANVDFIWNQIVSYRKRLTTTLELPDIDRTKFSLVFTQDISNRLLSYERMLNRAFYEYTTLTPFARRSFEMKRLIQILSRVATAAGAKQSDSFLASLIDNVVSAIPTDAIIVDNYLLALRYLSSHDAGTVVYTDFNALNEILNTGSEPLQPLSEKKYRTTSLDEPHYYQKGYIYKAALADRIDQMMNDVCLFISDGRQFSSVRAIAGMFYVDYVMPYDYMREQLACLTFKLALSRSGFASFASYLAIESLLLFKDARLQAAEGTVQKTFDLTYYFDYVLVFLESDIYEILDDLAAAQKAGVEHEAKTVGLSESEKDGFSRESEPENLDKTASPAPAAMPDPVEPRPPENIPQAAPAAAGKVQIYGEADISLPIFPSGLGEEDVQQIAVDLMETYPTLKKAQAHFYASHCIVGRSYTIQEFRSGEHTSYETARTSMDYLASLGFYEKAKIRNKFVYRPIPRR